MNDAIAQALADLERARAACLAALEDQYAFAPDKVRAASELRHLARQRLELLAQQADAEAERRQRAETGCWAG